MITTFLWSPPNASALACTHLNCNQVYFKYHKIIIFNGEILIKKPEERRVGLAKSSF